MPTIEPCMHCGKLCTDGFCPCRWPMGVESIFDNTGPAPKEEGMTPENQILQLRAEVKHKTEEIHNLLAQLREAQTINTDLRAHYDAVYLAEVGSGSGLGTAHTNALESVRTHAARMAELEAVITEGAGNG